MVSVQSLKKKVIYVKPIVIKETKMVFPLEII